MTKKIIAVYKDGYWNITDHFQYPALYPEPPIHSMMIVLYEDVTHPWWNLRHPIKKRGYDVYEDKDSSKSGIYLLTDTYVELVKPWLEGVELSYLDEMLKTNRLKINPKNKFIYKKYDEADIPISS
jgi:hypothetical protein